MGISLGLVGLGDFGTEFAKLFTAHPGVDRVALCDREPERIAQFAKNPIFQKKFHSRDAYDSLEAICQADLDALVIITQPWLHAPQAIQAMESGKSVYSAVPVISIPDDEATLDWCDRIVNTCRRTGRRYMLGETTFYHAGAMYCRRRAAEGAFGQFVYSEGEYLHAFDSHLCDLRKVEAHRLASKAGHEWTVLREQYRARGLRGGPMHYPTHSTSGPMSVMKAHAVKVCCWGMRPQTADPYFERSNLYFANETALFYMSNGSTMRILEHRQDSIPREDFRIHGTDGSFEFNTWYQKLEPTHLTDEQMREPLPPEVFAVFKTLGTEEGVYGGHGGSHAFLVQEFVDAVAHDRQPAINAWEAVRYMAAGVTAHQSALRDGEVLPVPDWGDAPG